MFSCIVVQLNYSKVSVLSITALLLSIALLHWHWQNGSILPPHWENHYARCKVLENEVNCSANLPGLWSMEWENYQVTNLKNFQETMIKNSKHPEGEQSSTRKRKVWLLSDWLLFTYYSHWRLVKIHITLHKTLVLSGRKGRREDGKKKKKWASLFKLLSGPRMLLLSKSPMTFWLLTALPSSVHLERKMFFIVIYCLYYSGFG